MRRRALFSLLGSVLWGGDTVQMEGVLRVPAVLETGAGPVKLEGDKPTTEVLADKR